MISFSENVAVITGAGSGLGRAIAAALEKLGCHLALVDNSPEGLKETVSLIGNTSRTLSTHIVNVTNEDKVKEFAATVITDFGQVDWVINNAGVIVSGFFEDLTMEDIEWVMRINYFGTVYMTKAFLPHLLKRRSGSIVNVSSLLGLIGAPTLGAYSATKFAVRGFTESLRMELVGTGVRAVSVHPGGIKTNLYAHSRYYRDYEGSPSREDAIKRYLDLCPLTPEKAAAKILKGLKKGKERMVVGPDAVIVDRLQRWFPASYPKILLYLHRFR